MSTRKWVDKKKATKFALVHRSHEDPLYYDEEAPDHVLMPITNGNDRKKHSIRLETKEDLAQKIKDEKMRENEGEAALYGVTFDDSKYDYMQHLKPIGGDDAGVFIEKKSAPHDNNNNKQKDIFQDLKEVLPSDEKLDLDYQDQQDIPDTIKGFKPDMDPRLREVLEALEDDAYLDEDQDVEEGDIFDDLLKGGKLDDDDYDEDYDEYDYDQYEDDFDDYNNASGKEETWEDDFNKFKKNQKKMVNDWDSDDDFEDEDDDEVPELPNLNDVKTTTTTKGAKQKLRRKKGAMTDTSAYSMSSSAVFRTEGLRLLDDRYEQLLKKQQKEDEEEEEYEPFDMSRERPDLESMLDDFLDNYEVEGGRRIVKKNAERDRLKLAALDASKGKMVARREREKGMSEVEKTLKGLRINQ